MAINGTERLEERIVNFAIRFIRHGSIAVKNFKIFGDKHPILENNLHNVYELLKTALLENSSITFTFLEGITLVENIKLTSLNPEEYPLIIEIRECGITSLTFSSGIREEELTLLFKTISLGPSFIRAGEGMVSIFQKKHIEQIKVDEIFFKKVSKKEEEERQAKDQLADVLIVDFLSGSASFSEADIEAIVSEVGKNPERISKIISKVAYSRVKQTASSAREIAALASERAYSNIVELSERIKRTGAKDSDVKKNIENLIAALEPSLRRATLERACREDTPNDIIKEAISEFSDKIISDILISECVEGNQSIFETRQLIRKLLPDEPKRKRILKFLEKKLIKQGISKDVCSQLFEGKFWIDMSIKEKAEDIRQKEALYCVDIGITQEVERLIKDLFDEREFDLAREVLNKVLDNFLKDDKAFKIKLAKDIRGITIFLFRFKGYMYKKEYLTRLQKEYEIAHEEELKASLQTLLIELINISIKDEDYFLLPFLIHAVRYDAVKDQALEGKAQEVFLNKLFSNDNVDRRLIKEVICEIGEDAKKILCNMIISIKGDDFDSYKKRYEMAKIIENSGGDIEGFLLDALTQGPIQVIKVSLEVLSEVGKERALFSINKFLTHKNKAIQESTKRAIMRIKGRIK